MAGSHSAFLLVVGDREALGWILREQRTAFPFARSRLSRSLEPGDRLVVYTTRGCFHDPRRDRGRVIATALVSTPVGSLDRPIFFGEREFTFGCRLAIERLAPFERGPELGPLVPRLRTFPDNWAMHVRRAVVRLDDHDYELLAREVSRVAVPREAALPAYLDRAVPVRRLSARQGSQP